MTKDEFATFVEDAKARRLHWDIEHERYDEGRGGLLPFHKDYKQSLIIEMVRRDLKGLRITLGGYQTVEFACGNILLHLDIQVYDPQRHHGQYGQWTPGVTVSTTGPPLADLRESDGERMAAELTAKALALLP